VKKQDFFLIDTEHDYNGIPQMKHMQDNDGNDVFLNKKELLSQSGRCTRLFRDGQMSDKCKQLLADWAARPRSLYLDITNNSVNTANNIFQQADFVHSLHPQTCIVTRCGPSGGDAGIHILYPGEHGWERIMDRNKTASDVLEELDSDLRVGLDMPVAFIGFRMMKRGTSFVSTRRVPTHICTVMGDAQTIENYVQALGRGCFDRASILRANNFDHVTVLARPEFDAVVAYLSFQTELLQKLEENDDLDLCLGPEAYYSWRSNFVRYTRKPIRRSKICL
jgi:hypothetical protein